MCDHYAVHTRMVKSKAIIKGPVVGWAGGPLFEEICPPRFLFPALPNQRDWFFPKNQASRTSR